MTATGREQPGNQIDPTMPVASSAPGEFFAEDLMIPERDLHLLLRSHGHVLSAIFAETEQERTRQNHLALLTAPLQRPPTANQHLVRVSTVYDALPGGAAAARATSAITLTNRVKLVDLRPGYTFVENGFVTAQGIVADAHHIYIHDSQHIKRGWENGTGDPGFQRYPPFSAYDPSDGTCYVEEPPDKVDQQVVLFNSRSGWQNFGHFIHDFMTQYPTYEEIRSKHGAVGCLFARQFKYPIQNFIVDKLFEAEFRDDRVRFIWGKPARYAGIFLPHPQFGVSGEIGVQSIRRVRQLLSGLARQYRATRGDPSSTGSGRVFVSRRDAVSNAYNRSALNQDVLEDSFRRHGFDIVTLSGKTPEEIFAIFSDAKIVAGVHGAGLLNIIFSSADSPLLIELDAIPKTWRSIECVIRALDFRHALVAAQKTEAGTEYPALDATIETLIESAA